jgi:hypothetical protein
VSDNYQCEPPAPSCFGSAMTKLLVAMMSTPNDNAEAWEPRTVRQWLTDLHLKLPDPTPEDARDFDTVMGHDEFWEWSSGKVDLNHLTNHRLDWRIVLLWLAVCGLGVLWMWAR